LCINEIAKVLAEGYRCISAHVIFLLFIYLVTPVTPVTPPFKGVGGAGWQLSGFICSSWEEALWLLKGGKNKIDGIFIL